MTRREFLNWIANHPLQLLAKFFSGYTRKPHRGNGTRLREFLAILSISFIGGSMFFALGMDLIPAIGIALLLLVLPLSTLNYLNHGKFRPFVSHSSIRR